MMKKIPITKKNCHIINTVVKIWSCKWSYWVKVNQKIELVTTTWLRSDVPVESTRMPTSTAEKHTWYKIFEWWIILVFSYVHECFRLVERKRNWWMVYVFSPMSTCTYHACSESKSSRELWGLHVSALLPEKRYLHKSSSVWRQCRKRTGWARQAASESEINVLIPDWRMIMRMCSSTPWRPRNITISQSKFHHPYSKCITCWFVATTQTPFNGCLRHILAESTLFTRICTHQNMRDTRCMSFSRCISLTNL